MANNPDGSMKRVLAIEIYQMFESHSEKRAMEYFDLYDRNPKHLTPEHRFLVKQSYTAAEMALIECAKVCDLFHEQDERNNGAAATGAAKLAAARLRLFSKLIFKH